MTRIFSRMLPFGLATCLTLQGYAQTDEQRAAARSLATDGAAAFNQGRWKDAVDMFSRAESLVHAPTHLLFLARSQEKLGALVRAQEAYLKITRETLPATAPQAFRDAQTAAEQELRKLEPRIASLTLQVEGAEAAKDLAVTVDGAPVPPALIGVPRPIDPGAHNIEAKATGFKAQAQALTLGEGEKKSVALRLEVDPNAPVPEAVPGGVAPVNPNLPPPAPIPPPAPTSEGSNGMRIGSYVAFGVGAVGVGLGTVFLISSHSKRSDADTADKACQAVMCRDGSPEAAKVSKLDDDARSALTLSIIGFAVGGVGIAAGTGLFLASSGHHESSGLRVQPWIGWRSAGLSGQF